MIIVYFVGLQLYSFKCMKILSRDIKKLAILTFLAKAAYYSQNVWQN